MLSQLHAGISDSCEHVVRWLMGVDPGGFKLNENLNQAIGCGVLCLLTLWRSVLHAVLLFLPPAQRIITLLSYGCLLGASVGNAIASDLLAFFSLHVVQLHRVVAACYAGYIAALYSLFNLFRGRKYNVLRQRVDSCDYDHEQLLLGTLLFTLLVFLFPTVAAYHGLATLVRLAVLGMQVILMALLLVLDRFPWFALLQWLLWPSRLRRGIKFQPLWATTAISPNAAGSCNTIYFELLTQEASVVPFFIWCHRLLTLLAGQYTAPYLARCLLFGQEVLPVKDCRGQL